MRFLVSVHKNPKAREPVLRNLSRIDNVSLFDPLDYPDYVNLIKRAYLVVSDSGGIQEEAPALGVPVILCREKKMCIRDRSRPMQELILETR